MSKGRKGRSRDQILRDRIQIADLYLRGCRQLQIGEKLGLSRQQIGHELNAVRLEWKNSALMDFNAKKAEELAKIDHLERSYWDAWEGSKKERHISTTEQTTAAEGDRFKAGIRKEVPTGDSSYLKGVQWCVEQRCKLLGLNAPTETRLTGKDGEALDVNFTIEQRRAELLGLIAVLRERARLEPPAGLVNGQLESLGDGSHRS